MSLTSIPKNQIISRNTIEQREHEDDAAARRVLLVDGAGNTVDTQHPLPVILTDGSINIETLNAQLAVQLSSQDIAGKLHDSIRIGNQTSELAINNDGSINVNVVNSVASNTSVVSKFGEALSVATGVSTTILTYTMPALKSGFLEKVSVSGENIAKFDVLLNGNKVETRRTYFGAELNGIFDFLSNNGDGLPLVSGDVITVKVVHNRPDIANFEARVQALEIS